MTPSIDTLPQPEKERWQLLRAAIQNVWEYDDQRFVFHRGKLLLRGRNESGKTKALEVLLPFLLDADLSPQRLDPFGSTSRPMRWNLLNESNPDEKIHVGYVWIELGRLDPSGRTRFCTIGAGLRARRSTTSVDVWYFLTELRPDLDLSLLDEQRVPLIKSHLEEALGTRGEVFERKIDYRRAVDRTLFGMTEAQYAALIEALIQLRRPQLSKRLQPSELSDILTASLPPLDLTVISPLVEGFDRLDRHRTEQEELTRTEGSIRTFLRTYKRYVASASAARARAVSAARAELESAGASLDHDQARHDETVAQQQQVVDRIVALEGEVDAVDEQLATLRTSEAFRALRELDDARRLARDAATRADKAENRAERERARSEEAETGLSKTRAQLAQNEDPLSRLRDEATDRAESALLTDGHQVALDQLDAGDLDAARGTSESVLADRTGLLDAVDAEHLRARDDEVAAQRASERLEDAEAALVEAREALEAAEQRSIEVKADFLGRVSRWAERATRLDLDASTRARLMNLPIEEMQDEIRRHGAEVSARLDERSDTLGAGLLQLERRLEELTHERDQIDDAPHRSPQPPPWRSPRGEGLTGGPLFLLCDFTMEEPSLRAGLEAALEASGLLDAWVHPTGQLLDADRCDVMLDPSPLPGRTLADVISPTPTNGLDRETITTALRSVRLGEDPEATCWVELDGRFRLGPLTGQGQRQEPAFIGATARAAAQQRKLEAIEAMVEQLEEQRGETEEALAEVRIARRELTEELDRFPSLTPVIDARAEVGAAGRAQAARRQAALEASDRLASARAALEASQTTQSGAAARLGLRGWTGSIAELRDRTRAWERAVFELLRQARSGAELRSKVEAAEAALERRKRLVEESEVDAGEARAEAERASARVAALQTSAETDRGELLETLREAEARRAAARTELDQLRSKRSLLDQQAGASASALTTAQSELEDVRRRAQQRDQDFSDFVKAGLLEVLDLDGVPADWSPDDLSTAAAAVEKATTKVDASAQARERAENRLAERHQELMRSLAQKDLRVLPRRIQGVLVYEVDHRGRRLPLIALAAELREDLDARQRLLDESERELFETFLSGETHEHLRSRLCEANQLVARMNGLLEKRPTSSGMQLRLRWKVTDDAPAGTAETIDLLLKSGHLLSADDREALRRFLRTRIDAARLSDGQGTLQERMLAVLDYRDWFAFAVEFRTAGSTSWRRLTRKAHGAGSGGQKAVMLHLPLFAAAAAFYESAAPWSARLIVLDEAFAGIDRDTRGQLMGLLCEFDLDFLMTSFDEWGFFEQLDGLSTYHLSRQRGVRGVYTDHFLWDGAAPTELDAA